MTSSHRLTMLKLSKLQEPKHVPIPFHLNHTLSPNPTPQQTNKPSPDFTQEDPARITATQLTNCTNLSALTQVHAHIVRTHMLELYYPVPFLWNNIMRSYVRLEWPSKALALYIAMSKAGVILDCYTLPIVLKALTRVFDVKLGRQVHSVAIKHGLGAQEFCESGFINFYSKFGEFENARQLFEENPERKLGSWNAVIGGLSQGGHAKEAITMFMELKRTGLKPDEVTMVTVTSACASLGDLNLALQLHKCVFQARSFGKPDIVMLNSLLDVYGKCGRMDLANRVFSRMEQRNVSSWTSMIVGYAMHGHVVEALDCFRCMRKDRVRPNSVTFVGVLSACVHGGMVQDGKRYFSMMDREYGIMPKLPHYGCMVDLLGRAGLLEEAKEMVEDMPMEANVVIWGCLMGACEKYGNVKMGEWVSKNFLELEPWNDGVYVVLSNIYANQGLWEEVGRVRSIMKERRLAKVPAYSSASNS